MKKAMATLVVVLALAVTASAEEIKPCRLMRDPVDPAGVVDWQKFCLFTTQESVNVEMSTGSGKLVKCELQPGTSVLTDVQSGEWISVRACFNTFPLGFRPDVRGRLDCAPPPEVKEVRVAEQQSSLTAEDIEKAVKKVLEKRTPTPEPLPPPLQKEPSWFRLHWKGVTVGGGIAGAFIYLLTRGHDHPHHRSHGGPDNPPLP